MLGVATCRPRSVSGAGEQVHDPARGRVHGLVVGSRRQDAGSLSRTRRARGTYPAGMTPWPLFDLVLTCRGVTLHVVRDAEVAPLAELQPDDFEHDPAAELFDALDEATQRRRLFRQGIWRNRGTWSPTSWCLDLAVEHEGALVGVQSLEAESFPTLRTVDSASWLVPSARGRGLGVAMRTAVLGLAFDRLGARAAVSSATLDNGASLGVSRSIGYADNGVGVVLGPNGVETLQYLRLTSDEWVASGLGDPVSVTGFDGCEPWFGLPAST